MGVAPDGPPPVPPRWRLLPGAWVLVHYRRRWLARDAVAGTTVAAYLVPQVLAYAEVAGLPPITGLWAVLLPLATYALLGSSRLLSVGPESTTALMTGVAVASLTGGDHARALPVAALLAVGVGAVCLLARLLRLGFLAHLLSLPVLTGYLAGIAVLMVVSQLPRTTGVPVSGATTLAELVSFVRSAGQARPAPVLLAGLVVLALVVLARRHPRWPGPLLVVTASALVVAAAGLDRHGVAVVGRVPAGLPALAVPSVTGVDPAALVSAALGLAVVAYSDNTLTARAFAARRGEEVDTDQELVALGVANLASGLGSGFPVSSSGSRTAIAELSGARTQVASLVTLGLVLLTLVVLAPALGSVPQAALGGLVVYAASRLVDLRQFRRLARFRRSELLLALLTAAAVVGFDVLQGIGVAVVLSLVDVLRRIAAPHDGVLGYVPGLAGMHDVDDHPGARQVPGLVVYRYDSPLFFANAENFRRRALAAVEQAGRTAPVRWLLLNAEAVTEIDLTAVDALEELRRTLEARGVVLALARVKHELLVSLEAAGFVARLGPDRVFATLPTGVEEYERWCAGGSAVEGRT